MGRRAAWEMEAAERIFMCTRPPLWPNHPQQQRLRMPRRNRMNQPPLTSLLPLLSRLRLQNDRNHPPLPLLHHCTCQLAPPLPHSPPSPTACWWVVSPLTLAPPLTPTLTRRKEGRRNMT